MRPDKGAVRLVRAAALLSVVLGLATAAHAIGGAGLPPWQDVLVLGAVLAPFALIGTSVRLNRGWLVAALAAGQAVGHVGFAALAGRASCAAPIAPAGPTGHLVPAGHAGHLQSAGRASSVTECANAVVAFGTAGSSPAGHADHLVASPSLLMLVTHAVATLLTAWLLARGEDVLWRTVRWLVPSLPPRRVAVGPRAHIVTGAQFWVPHRPHLLSVRLGRAPPALVGS